MREILFRGKRISNGEWVQGFYCQFHNRPITNEENSHQIFVAMENAVPFGSMIGGLWYKVIPETIGQYTGLKDKNGTKIFEGDILCYRSQTRDLLGIVVSEEWNCSCCNGVFGFSVDGIKGFSTPDLRDYDTSEVVGNIFDDDIK